MLKAPILFFMFLMLTTFNICAQSNDRSFYLTGNGFFKWKHLNNSSDFGTIDVYQYSMSGKLVRSKNINSAENRIDIVSGVGIHMQFRNLDQYSDSIIILDRSYNISPFLRFNIIRGLYFDIGISFEWYSHNSIDHSTNIYFQRLPNRNNNYLQVSSGYLYRFNKQFAITPVLSLPIIPKEIEKINAASWRKIISIELTYIFNNR